MRNYHQGLLDAIYLSLAVAIVGWVLFAIAGCNGIDVKVRPGGKLHPDESVVQPAPPTPPPPNDDWAPPWFRRGK